MGSYFLLLIDKYLSSNAPFSTTDKITNTKTDNDNNKSDFGKSKYYFTVGYLRNVIQLPHYTAFSAIHYTLVYYDKFFTQIKIIICLAASYTH